MTSLSGLQLKFQFNITDIAFKKAAFKARSLSAFRSAATFAERGIGMLPEENIWSFDRSFALQLYTMGVALQNEAM